jgi:hypothetical protein
MALVNIGRDAAFAQALPSHGKVEPAEESDDDSMDEEDDVLVGRIQRLGTMGTRTDSTHTRIAAMANLNRYCFASRLPHADGWLRCIVLPSFDYNKCQPSRKFAAIVLGCGHSTLTTAAILSVTRTQHPFLIVDVAGALLLPARQSLVLDQNRDPSTLVEEIWDAI